MICEPSGGNHTRSSNEFRFWSNTFDGLKLLYDHLNATEDVNKVKTIRRRKLTQNISSYMMRCVVLNRRLFEAGDESEQNEMKLCQEVTQLWEHQKAQAIRLSDLEKQLLEEKTRGEKLEAMNQKLKSTVNQQFEKINSLQDLNVQLQNSLQKAESDVLDTSDIAFDWSKSQTLFIYPELDLPEMDFFKVVVNGLLVDIEEAEFSNPGRLCFC